MGIRLWWLVPAEPADDPEVRMDEHDEIYGRERSEHLRALLREFADNIRQYDQDGVLLADIPALLRALGDLRSELFHYEVRSTYDSPEVARNRQIVDEARGGSDSLLDVEPEDDEPWRPKGQK
jgi:hypothetical protein